MVYFVEEGGCENVRIGDKNQHGQQLEAKTVVKTGSVNHRCEN